MPIGILNNIASLAAENNLSTTNTNLQSVLLQLSSGQRINSGADDAAGLAIANGLQANISALTQSASNANNGVGELQVADGALSQVTSLLNRAVTLATEASTGTVSDSQRTAIQAEFGQITQEIDQIGQNTTFNGAAVFTGAAANNNQLTTAVTNAAGTATAITGNLTVKYWDTSLAVPTYTTTTYQGGAGHDTTVGALINDINGSGRGLVATVDNTGNLVVTDTQSRGSVNALADGGATTLKIGADGSAETLASTHNSSTKDIYLGDSTVAGAEHIYVTLNTFDSAHMNGISLSSDNLSSAGTAQTTLIDLNNAIAQVAALRGSLGASVNRLQSASNVVSNQVQNVTSAENTIMAADIPTTVAKMTSDSILEQTGISALAQANQQQQLVLKLLQ